MIRRILLVEDDDQYASLVHQQLAQANFQVTWVARADVALDQLVEAQFDLVLTDILMPGMSGLDFLDELGRRGLGTPVVVMSAFGSVDTAIQAMKRGAYDYISKPFKKDELLLAILKLEERESLRRQVVGLELKLRAEERFGEIVGRSEAMAEVYSLVAKVAPFRTTVLVAGESGTGKELVARAIHARSPRQGAFVALNCGAIPEHLLESELFGHVRGAFTDAHSDRKGLFEEADGGTLFLDEVGELPQALQVKLLRVLQDGEVRRVGATKSNQVDVRVLAATAKDLQAEASSGRFREDLFYRLNVVQIRMPPLRERIGDIEALVRHFVEKTNGRLGTSLTGVDSEAMKALMAYSWPGNVRELENLIERAAVLAEGSVIALRNLPDVVARSRRERTDRDADDLSIKKAVRDLETRFIRAALLGTGGNRTRAAQILEISHRALLYKIREYEINVPHTPG
ncbi:MAG: sigma-54-dependent Fis family transcriptional regulator [Deltaproteobacteria bacterium]|nr:sigma-54-dependent Fis family transcriptional regulator [Deltaproteobacteria bacterium]